MGLKQRHNAEADTLSPLSFLLALAVSKTASCQCYTAARAGSAPRASSGIMTCERPLLAFAQEGHPVLWALKRLFGVACQEQGSGSCREQRQWTCWLL